MQMKKQKRGGIHTIERGKMSRREFFKTTTALAAAGTTALLLPGNSAKADVPLGMVGRRTAGNGGHLGI
jgi:hypothetical protein